MDAQPGRVWAHRSLRWPIGWTRPPFIAIPGDLGGIPLDRLRSTYLH
jgi:hypothetical protein